MMLLLVLLLSLLSKGLERALTDSERAHEFPQGSTDPLLSGGLGLWFRLERACLSRVNL